MKISRFHFCGTQQCNKDSKMTMKKIQIMKFGPEKLYHCLLSLNKLLFEEGFEPFQVDIV